MVTGHMFGHKIYQDEKGCWRWADNGMNADKNPRPCPKCNQLPNKNGHDPCLGTIEGVFAACCGHGIQDGIILWYPGDSPRNEDGHYWYAIFERRNE